MKPERIEQLKKLANDTLTESLETQFGGELPEHWWFMADIGYSPSEEKVLFTSCVYMEGVSNGCCNTYAFDPEDAFLHEQIEASAIESANVFVGFYHGWMQCERTAQELRED